ncbi:helix-turn-helix domain-containing protein [Anaerobacillus sp. CMMVII]|uniref:helix-turn-helix transcriptional regulator n=1 Tax=Anaerobacillus sp. CMMVII TaxID=2755588 RepID=UPI0021B704EA|nr:helix-turn-helix domain-containing protein [Anaerobacillus sp. CMMVII]MCT8138587.1 helix-turn-helix domain-containing protein [Anaerobacillus sp. CMMVII]
MEHQTLKITGVLSDPTRFSIYQYVTKQHRDVTVQEIADSFEIHANVARLHLTKLEDVNMLVSETKKTGKGGRPSRFYRLSDEVVSLQFPYRDYQKLSEIAIDTLLSLGDIGEEALMKTGRKFGYETSRTYLQGLDLSLNQLSSEEKLNHIKIVALQQGLNPEMHYDPETHEVNFRIYNCTFKELVPDRIPICRMHQALINGFFDFFFGEINLDKNANMSDTKEYSFCSYKTLVLP